MSPRARSTRPGIDINETSASHVPACAQYTAIAAQHGSSENPCPRVRAVHPIVEIAVGLRQVGHHETWMGSQGGMLGLHHPPRARSHVCAQWHSFSEFCHSVKDSVLGLGCPLIFYSVSGLSLPVLSFLGATFRSVSGIAAHRAGPGGAVAGTGRSRRPCEPADAC